MARPHRVVNPDALERHASPALRATIGRGTRAWRYTVLVPVEEIRPGKRSRRIATGKDLTILGLMFGKHFGGYTTGSSEPSLIGWGARDPQRPEETREGNKHAFFTIYAAVLTASDDYFLALRRELEDALQEGVILIERQDVTIL